MRIKGITKVTTADALLCMETGLLTVTDEQVQALGDPGPSDIFIALTTKDPGFQEIYCITDIPPECRDIRHIVEDHLKDLYDAFHATRH